MEPTERLGAALRALRITEIVYSLSGGGDSGETTLESVAYQDNSLAHALPDVPIQITDTGRVRHLAELLEDLVADAPEGDWVNGEGGHGTVTVRPFDDENLAIDCDMTFREEGDYGDDEDEFTDDEFDDAEDEERGDGLATAVPNAGLTGRLA